MQVFNRLNLTCHMCDVGQLISKQQNQWICYLYPSPSISMYKAIYPAE